MRLAVVSQADDALSPYVTPAPEARRRVDAIASKSRALASIFSGSFVTASKAADVARLALEIQDEARALRKVAP